MKFIWMISCISPYFNVPLANLHEKKNLETQTLQDQKFYYSVNKNAIVPCLLVAGWPERFNSGTAQK